jgi:tetratricopeptide (TPR) repeat protein
MYLTHQRCVAWHDSLTLWNDIIEKCPSTPAYYNRGTTLIFRKQFGQAVQDLTRAIAGCPTLALAYSNRGAAYYMMGRYGEAIADFDSALALKPDYSEARYDRDHAIKAFEAKQAERERLRH